MASKLTRSKLPILSNKEGKLKYSFKPRVNEGAKSKVKVVELSFQTPVSKKCTCVLCRKLLRDPCQVTCCSSNYCRECINSLSNTSGKCASKDCGKNYAIITDGPAVEEIARRIAQLKVYCFLREDGCKWVGTIEQLEQEHFISSKYSKRDTLACQFQEVKCPNKCGAIIPRGSMVGHRLTDCAKELSVCEYCGIEDNSYEIYRVHMEVCPLVPVECPNKCGVPGTARSKIISHLENECPLRLVSCIYRHVGCEDQVRFLNLNTHVTMSYQKHLDLMSEKLEFVSNENDELRREKLSDVEMFVSKLKDLQAGISSVEELLEDYEAVAESTRSDIECLPSSVSAGSCHTLTGGGSSEEEEDSESGYNSVVNEITGKINGLTSKLDLHNRLEGTPEFINGENKYMNVRRQSTSNKVLPDVCATTPRSRHSYENTASHPTSDKLPKGRYSVPTIKHSLGGKAGTERSASFPAGNYPELFDSSHMARVDGELNLSSGSENFDTFGTKGMDDKSRSAVSARSGTPDFYEEINGSYNQETPAQESVEENGEEVEDPWKITIPQLREETSDATHVSAPRVTFKREVDNIMSHFFIGEEEHDDSDGESYDDEDDDDDDDDEEEEEEEEKEEFPQLDSGSPEMANNSRKAKRASKARDVASQDVDNQLSHSSAYDLPVRLEFVSKGYNLKFSEAFRPRNLSSSSSAGMLPPIPPRTRTRSLESLLDEPPGMSTFVPGESQPPIEEAAARSDLSDGPFPFPRASKIKPIPVEPPKIGSLSSNGIGLAPRKIRKPKEYGSETTDPAEMISKVSMPSIGPNQPSKGSPTRASKPLPPTPSRARRASESAGSAGLLSSSTTSKGLPTRTPRPLPDTPSQPRFGSCREPIPLPRKRLASVTSRPFHPSLKAGSSVSLPVHDLDMNELKDAIKRRSNFFS